ncbi:MAG: tRNA (guanosine(46)-N7)-methyltransferase TrmB [Gemmataceae bacterium]|nr:tRNA (guanosine(46)-N7)-methyltransferase TrmB [Gemmataceae bacterium]
MRRTKRLPLEQLTPYLCEPPFPEPLDWRAVFGNDRPVEIEVGFGKGLFLLNSALQHPDVNYFGIEIMRKYQLFTATRMAIRQLTNVRLAKADARHFMKVHVVPGSVRAIHVYFPDPWWKKRHHKRRLFTAEFVAACTAALQADGEFRLATDVAEYFAVMTELCTAQPQLALVNTSEVVDTSAGSFLTNFERKAQLKGTPVHRATYRKRTPETTSPTSGGTTDTTTPPTIS